VGKGAEGWLERPKFISEDESNMDLKVVGWNVADWISMAQICINSGLV
jgi:hypothetical protein